MNFNFSISRVLTLIFVSVVLVAGGIIFAFSSYVQNKSVYKIAKEDAHTRAELIFESIYAVMKNGLDREEINQVVGRFNHNLPSMKLRLIRSKEVADLFGEIDDAAHARQNDPLIKQVFLDKQERILENGENLRFIYPISSEPECLQCHTNARLGDLNGLLEITFPITEISIPLEYAINTIISIFAVIIMFLVIITILSVRYFMVSPLLNLSEYMEAIKGHETFDDPPKSKIYEIETLRGSFGDLIDHLNTANDELKDLTITDPLTGLSNRRHFNELLNDEQVRAKRYNHPFSIFMIDLDKFKPINDEYGHDAGDYVLKVFAETLKENLRTTDHIARVGGDEFQVISPETDNTQAQEIISKIRKAVEGIDAKYNGHHFKISCSIGAATFGKDNEDLDSLKRLADNNMYADKKLRKTGR